VGSIETLSSGLLSNVIATPIRTSRALSATAIDPERVPLHALPDADYTGSIYTHYWRLLDRIAARKQHPEGLSATATMRREEYHDDEEGGFEMKPNPKHRYERQWGHWNGPEGDDGAMFQRKSWQRFVDSFRRDPDSNISPHGIVGGNGRVFDPKTAALATARAPLARRLKGRHLQMIAFGGSIGS
jgi:hypothetical protein